MEHRFAGFTLVHIPRAENMVANSVAKAVAQGETLPPDVFYEVPTEPAAGELEDEDEREVLAILEGGCCNYRLVDGVLYKGVISCSTTSTEGSVVPMRPSGLSSARPSDRASTGPLRYLTPRSWCGGVTRANASQR